MEEVPECIIVASKLNIRILYANPKAISVCSDLGIENGVRLAEKIMMVRGTAEIATLRKENEEDKLNPLAQRVNSGSESAHKLGE